MLSTSLIGIIEDNLLQRTYTIMENDKACGICGNPIVFATCSLCGMQTCENCTRYDLMHSGCCFIWTAYYCSNCVHNTISDQNDTQRGSEK